MKHTIIYIALCCLIGCLWACGGGEDDTFVVYKPFEGADDVAATPAPSAPQPQVEEEAMDGLDEAGGEQAAESAPVAAADAEAATRLRAAAAEVAVPEGAVAPALDSILNPPAYNPWDEHLPDMPDDGCVKLKINGVGGTLGKVFCDSNNLHLQAARALGIDPVRSERDAWHLRRPIVEVSSCPEYVIDDLSHSYPYLVPEAEALLREIGRRFNAELQQRGGGSYRLKVTSLLRTDATVSRLRRRNVNATETSAHLFATTFDISYSKFICDAQTVNRTQEDLKNLLAEVLFELRSEGRCYVKYERKQSCFHITTRPAAPL